MPITKDSTAITLVLMVLLSISLWSFRAEDAKLLLMHMRCKQPVLLCHLHNLNLW